MPPAAIIKRPTLKYEREWMARGHLKVAGVDEAGRGPLAGPVSVAAVILPDGFKHRELNDSKQLKESTRAKIYDELMALPGLIWSVLLLDVEEIDRINILQATRMGMRRVVQTLSVTPDVALIDGLKVPDFPIPQQALVKGDSLSLSIAAASVIAKVTRDRYMIEAGFQYPQYEFHQHKGYGTPKHLEALRLHGPCPLHRRSFAPVSQLNLAFDAA